jgi:hypothetical protein
MGPRFVARTDRVIVWMTDWRRPRLAPASVDRARHVRTHRSFDRCGTLDAGS